MLSGSEIFYFLQPIATTLVGAAVFLISLAIGRPLIGSAGRRLLSDLG